MFVAANYMKSYALSPMEFAKKAVESKKYGADLIYVVDSSGGMFPEQIREYYLAIKDSCDIAIGFHGHNNLGLAIANSLEAFKVGYDFIDTTLQGLGRSAGNAPTEVFLAALAKLGHHNNIDLIKILDLGYSYINPMIDARGWQPLDIVSGYADFHSSYMHLIHKYSSEYSVRPELLIIELCKINKIDAPEDLVRQIASSLKREDGIYMGKYRFNRYIGREQDRK